MTHPPPSAPNFSSSEPDEDLWHVHFGGEDVRLMSLDQLDDAFRLGLIDSQTAVWTEGMANWERLGDAAGLDESDDLGAAGLSQEPVDGQGAFPVESGADEQQHLPALAEQALPIQPTNEAARPFLPVLSPLITPAPVSAEGPFPPQLPPLNEFDSLTGDENTGPTAMSLDDEYPFRPTGGRLSGTVRGWLMATAGLAATAALGLLVSSGGASTSVQPEAEVSAASAPPEAPGLGLSPSTPPPSAAAAPQLAVAPKFDRGSLPIAQLRADERAAPPEDGAADDPIAIARLDQGDDHLDSDSAPPVQPSKSEVRKRASKRRAKARAERRAKARAKRRAKSRAARRAKARAGRNGSAETKRRSRPRKQGKRRLAASEGPGATRFDPLNASLP